MTVPVYKMMSVECVVGMIVLAQDVLMKQHVIMRLLQSLMMARARFLMNAEFVEEITQPV